LKKKNVWKISLCTDNMKECDIGI